MSMALVTWQGYRAPNLAEETFQYRADAGGTELPFELTAVVDGTPHKVAEKDAMLLTAAQWDERFGGEDGSAQGSDEPGAQDGSASDAADQAESQPADASTGGSADSATDSSSAPASEPTSDASPEAAAADSSDGDAGILPWALGGAGVVALVGGLLLAARRRA